MSHYADYLQDVFVELGPVTCRKMFGGYGVYHQGLMFALVADDVLYLKVDADTRPDYEARGLLPFCFEKSGKPVQMSYHQAPEDIFDDPELAARWGRAAWQAARRSKAGKHACP